jgi:hypothetical protein
MRTCTRISLGAGIYHDLHWCNGNAKKNTHNSLAFER